MTNMCNDRSSIPCLRKVFLFAAIFTLSLSCVGIRAEPAQPGQSNRTLVVIVPGTIGNAEFWPKEMIDKSTFGSELKRGLGNGTTIYPYLWDGDNDNSSRQIAAGNLAKLIDRKATDFEKICLVGHSYGGDIALMAAGLSHSKIDTVVCLSTPHLYLMTKRTSNGKILLLPAYCSYEARQNVKSIVNICPDGDNGVINLADAFPGITEKIVIPMTQSWQEHAGFPRLAEEGMVRLLGEVDQGNLKIGEFLNAANANEQFQSFVRTGILGLDQHGAVHSRRMGYIVGQLLEDAQSKEHLDYLHSLVQPKDADHGEPIAKNEQVKWTEQHAADFEQIGWRLDKITVSFDAGIQAKFGPHSTMFLHMLGGPADGGQDISKLGPVNPKGNVTWDNTKLILRQEQAIKLVVSAGPALGLVTNLGTYQVGSQMKPPTSLPADIAHNVYWSADLSWTSVHY